MPNDFLVRGSLAELDPDVYELGLIESERQYRKIILIASESSAPRAVLEALNSGFNNIYAEGYPDDETRRMSEAEILDYPARLADYRRYSDPRYYKGVEYADTVEALARRRCAELFANSRAKADDLWVNVQPLSGAPANNAVYHALVNPGDMVMGMNLLHGGHLSHGSPVNRSGKYYRMVSYGIDPQTERIDYDEVARLAQEHKPKMIIAGFTSYPYVPDWEAFRSIADSVGACLLADIAHIAGMVAAGVLASPVGIADVVSFTTHKSLCGPRGAVVLTHKADIGKKIDRAVFPGEQGGPHINVLAAMAVAFKLDKAPAFRELQTRIVSNAARLASQLEAHGFRIPFGGTDTHLINVDCKSVVGADGTTLSGDLAARVLDNAGVVVNRNTIPGDRSAFAASGLRLGTPWVTQRGFGEPEIDRLADCMARILMACQPYRAVGRGGRALQRTRLNFEAFNEAKIGVRDLAQAMSIDFEPAEHGYPHFYYLDDPAPSGKYSILDVRGRRAEEFLDWAADGEMLALKPNDTAALRVNANGRLAEGTIMRVGNGREHYHLTVPSTDSSLVATWLRDLSDGFIGFGASDLHAKLPGPVQVAEHGPTEELPPTSITFDNQAKPWYIGVELGSPGERAAGLPEFHWEEPTEALLKKTALNDTHRKLGGRMVPFAGWEMPVQYTGVIEEHLAVRQAAGLFDVSHMGVYDVQGPGARAFLDAVCGNEIAALGIGESLYTHFLDPDANVIDDLLVYRRGEERFLIVVNASNDDENWAWLNAVKEARVLIDRDRPWAAAPGRDHCTLRNLRDPSSGSDMRVDIALQGPKSRDILLALGADPETARRVKALKRTELCDAVIGGFDLIVSRTGYTGEAMAFELFVHPDRSPEFWEALLRVGAPLGLKPAGLAARDSTRTEAGLPLYGHEMAGPLGLGVGEAGFESYVKLHKPWFIGRKAFLAREDRRKGEVARFRFNEKTGRMAHQGDPVVDRSGRVIGAVTSCSIDTEGYRLGQAFLELKYTEEGTSIFIFQSASDKAEKPRAQLRPGERVTLPEAAAVLSRFPKKK